MKQLKVFLADDEKIVLTGLRMMYAWEEHGYEIVGDATDGINAQEKIKELVPDIVIIDIDMPLRSGIEVISSLHDSMKDTRFIILSGYSDYEYMRSAVKLNVSDYLLKPVTAKALDQVLNDAREDILNDRNMINSLFVESKSQNSENQILISQITEFIGQHLSEKLSLSAMGEQFHMSSDYFGAYFKKHTSRNFTDYLNTCRVAKAKELLKDTDMSMAEISETVGFNDYRYMNKVFYSYLHITPSQYRKDKQH